MTLSRIELDIILGVDRCLSSHICRNKDFTLGYKCLSRSEMVPKFTPEDFLVNRIPNTPISTGRN